MIDIKRFCFDMGISQTGFGEKIGVDQSVVSHMIKGSRKLRQDHIERLEAEYGKDVVQSYEINEAVTNMITKPQATEVKAEIIPAQVVEEIRAEAVEEIKAEEAIPFISNEIATKPNLDIRDYINKNASELEHINPRDMLGNPSACEKVMTTSMIPTFQPNDIVFVKFLPEKKHIIDGHTYYFDFKNRPTMIRKVKLLPDGGLCLIAQNPMYGDIITTFDDINNVAKIIGMLRLTFGNQYAEIEEMRRKKDAQVDALIQEVSKAGVRVDKMMEQMSLLVKQAIEKK